ncbi:MAG TPA: hypothetical protein VI977_03410 [archaeon]|nr:hypothetical protein [archaeon]
MVPIKKFKAGAIQVAIWENETKEGGKYNTVSFDKRYKDKNDEWKTSGSLQMNDLPKAILALQRAFEYLAFKDAAEAE